MRWRYGRDLGRGKRVLLPPSHTHSLTLLFQPQPRLDKVTESRPVSPDARSVCRTASTCRRAFRRPLVRVRSVRTQGDRVALSGSPRFNTFPLAPLPPPSAPMTASVRQLRHGKRRGISQKRAPCRKKKKPQLPPPKAGARHDISVRTDILEELPLFFPEDFFRAPTPPRSANFRQRFGAAPHRSTPDGSVAKAIRSTDTDRREECRCA